MIALQTVLCPVDFSPATPRQVDLAAELCRAFGARLVLHHNRHSLGAGASVGWMWNADHQGDCRTVQEAKLRDCLARVPDGVRVEPLTTEGPPSRAVLAAGDLVQADLFVLTAHGTLSDDHASITQKVIEDSGRAVLVLHEPNVEPRTPRFASKSTDPQVVLAPTDLDPVPGAALEMGFELARQLPIELHLLHVVPNARGWRGHDVISDEDARGRLRALVPDDLDGRVQVHVEHGNVGHRIAAAAEHLSAVCIVMGEHTGAARRWFGRNTPQVVLHEAHCPVWYVPCTRPAQAADSRLRLET
jgi:nucleotide-binding universal stress UspA family protein